MSSWQFGLGLLGAAAYAALSHALMLHAAQAPWAVAALLGPLLCVTGAMALRSRHWGVLGVVLAAVVALGVVVWRGGVEQITRLYLIQHVGIHVMLGFVFAASLRGEVSLVGRIARTVHGGLTPGMAAYTRKVTLVWVVYFFAMAALSVASYALAPWSVWSLLANVASPVAMGVLFIGEYLLRYRLHPEFERATLMDAVRAYRSAHQAPEPLGR